MSKMQQYVDGMIANARRECAGQPVDGLIIMSRVEGYLSGVRETIAGTKNADIFPEDEYRELLEKVQLQQEFYRGRIKLGR